MKALITKIFKAALFRNSSDPEFRIRHSIYISLALNIAYSALQLGIGIYYSGIWYYAMSGYYFLLALIRLFLIKNTGTVKENAKYGITGAVLLLMNIALAVMVFIAISDEQDFAKGEITAIALAAYTFTSLTLSIIGCTKYKSSERPVFSAAKTISLSAALVSMLSLEATMLSTFGSPNDRGFRSLMIGLFGSAIFIFITVMAIYMIINAYKKIKEEKIRRMHREYNG